MSDTDRFQPRVEEDVVARRPLWGAAAVALAVLVASTFVAGALLSLTARGRSPLHAAAPPPAPPQLGIVEQTAIEDGRRGLDLREEQRESLRHFGWIDRDAGLARVPIDRAMDLVVERAHAQPGSP